MLSFLKTIAIIALVVLIGFIIYNLPRTAEQTPPKETPCGDMVWMKDAPQARCVEYWNNIKMEEV